MFMNLIEHIKNEMQLWYGFNLTYQQVKDYVSSNKLEYFDTWERENFGQFLAKK